MLRTGVWHTLTSGRKPCGCLATRKNGTTGLSGHLMTDDALDRAARAVWEANGYAKYSDADWPDLPMHVRTHWREVAVAALRVMAEDIRENYTRIQREEFGRGISADRLEAVIDRYVAL